VCDGPIATAARGRIADCHRKCGEVNRALDRIQAAFNFAGWSIVDGPPEEDGVDVVALARWLGTQLAATRTTIINKHANPAKLAKLKRDNQ